MSETDHPRNGSPKPLRCPYDGGAIETVLEYASARSYSEHRDHTGFQCENYACDASWAPNGDVRELPKLAESASGNEEPA